MNELPNYIMRQKKVHKLSRWYSKWRQEWDVRPVCKVDNFSTAIRKSTKWHKVTCKKCLKKKPIETEKCRGCYEIS